ncbi:hypothetical protein GGS24DRAFT_480045, partial [Hypoxylon argillaceum]
MELSTEAIIAIIALFIALPPVLVIFVQLFRRYRSQNIIRGDLIELEAQRWKSYSQSLQNPPWRTTSIRMVFEGGHLREITQNQRSGQGADLESNLSQLLPNGQTAGSQSRYNPLPMSRT